MIDETISNKNVPYAALGAYWAKISAIDIVMKKT
jgi:hypothetical protein